MSAHPIGSATLSFGLVSVPVKMYSTGEASAAISFNWLHKKDGSRLKQQYVCAKDGAKVEKDEMVKGYEFSKGQYVIFTPEELKSLEEKSTNAIEVAEFVPAKQVDRVFVEKSYFLGPDKGGERAYRLLTEALKQTQRKVEGKEITEEPAEAPKTQIIDLMEALKASLKTKGGAGGSERKPAKRVEQKPGAKAAAAPAAKRKVGGARG